MAIEKTMGYGLSISRSHSNRGWVRVTLRKHMWAHDAGSRSRLVAETGFYAMGMTEADIVESALRELLRSYVDDIA